MSGFVRCVAAFGLLALVTASTGCVTRATYQAAVARGRALERDLESSRADVDAARRRLAELGEEKDALEITRQAMSRERIELIERNEDLRLQSDTLARRLEAERVALAEAADSYQSLVDELEQEVSSGRIEIQRLQGRLQVRALDRILFPSGSAEVTREGEGVLRRLAEQIRKLPDQNVRVEGHTDNVPIATARFPSNWELSAARAARVVRAFEEAGVSADKLEAVGFGPNRPIESNETAEGRSRNRRIEIVLVPVGE